MLLWSGVEQGRYRLAWIAAFLLPLSRAVGVFIVLPIGWHLLVDQRWRWLCRWRWLDVEQERLRSGGSVGAHWQGYALMAAPLLGLALYFVSMWRWTGNPFEGIEAQGFWGTHSIGHLWNVPKFIVGFFGPTRWHGYSGSVLDRCAFMLLVYCLPLIWRMGKDLVVWTYVLGILPAMSGTLTSFTRYESTTFPLFIALSIFFVGMKKKWPLIVFLVLSAIIHGTLLWRFVNFRWAG